VDRDDEDEDEGGDDDESVEGLFVEERGMNESRELEEESDCDCVHEERLRRGTTESEEEGGG